MVLCEVTEKDSLSHSIEQECLGVNKRDIRCQDLTHETCFTRVRTVLVAYQDMFY